MEELLDQEPAQELEKDIEPDAPSVSYNAIIAAGSIIGEAISRGVFKPDELINIVPIYAELTNFSKGCEELSKINEDKE